MKNKPRSVKILIVIFIIMLIIGVSAFGYYYYYMNYEENLSCRPTDDIIMINDLHSSMYLIKTDNGYIAIDAGYFSGVVEKALEYNEISPEKIRAVLLTNTDSDHQGAINLFTKATVYLSSIEYYMAKEGTQRIDLFPFYSNSINFKNYFLMKDNDEYTIGNRKIKCVALPGYTMGSMGYIIDNKYFFSGNAFCIDNGKIELPSIRIFTMNSEQMESSVKRAAQLKGIKYIFSSRSGFTSDFDYAISDLNK